MKNHHQYNGEHATVAVGQRLEHETDILRHMTEDFFAKEELEKQLAKLRHGDHACSFYQDRTEQEALVSFFVHEGLARGEHCVYVVDDRTIEEVATALRRAGVDISREQRRGALQFINRAQWRNPGDFDVVAMGEGVKRLVKQALAPGWPGLWIAVEMTWALSPDVNPERLAEWEAFWNTLITDMPAVLLCQYNRRRIPPAAVYLELKTHPLIVTPHEVYRNFYYEPPDLFLNQEAYGERVEWMLEQFQRARALEEERSRRLQEQAARAQAEAAQKRVTSILESITDGFFAVDSHWQITYLNKRAEQLLHRRCEELLGKNVWEEFPAAVSNSICFDQCQKAVAEQVAVEFEWFYPVLNTWFAVYGYPSPDGLSVYLHDISERKRAEEVLAQRTAELQRSNEELQQFAYVASHDLQEPLRMVASFTQLLAQRYQGQLDTEADEFINYVVDGAKRMQQLIQDLLAYTRAGGTTQEWASVDCEAVLACTLKDLQLAIQDTQAEVTHDPLPKVWGDAKQIGLVFQNLISNALKFCGEAPPRVHISTQQAGSQWTFTVKDNGIGIDPQYADKIFELFQRLYTRQEYPGTGIGLAICRKTVERHRGRIWVESEQGKGTTFFFTLLAA